MNTAAFKLKIGLFTNKFCLYIIKISSKVWHTGLFLGPLVCWTSHQSWVHSHTLPIMFFNPYLFWSGNAVTYNI